MQMNGNIYKPLFLNMLFIKWLVSIWVGILLIGVNQVTLAALSSDQTTFETAELAVDAFEKALTQNDTQALLKIFGKQYEHQLMADDAQNRDLAAQILKEKKVLYGEGKDKIVLYAGNKSWPFPVPIIKSGNGWFYDTEAGIEEMVNRRIGRNELNAIDMCRFYSQAQVQYAFLDRDGDEVLEYAQQIKSSPDRKDGLYWIEQEGEALSPFGPLVAEANGLLDNHQPGDPYDGYYYKILTRQGRNAIGGRYDYIIHGNMIAGFALLAFPAEYGNTGIMTFICSHQGSVYQKDYGEETSYIVPGIDVYNPDSSWEKVKMD